MCVAGAGVDNAVVLLAGIAGLLAGAFSMAAGEYISMRVQREVFERLIHLEAHELGMDDAAERAELAALYVRKGLSAELAERVAADLMGDPSVALETHAREELGLDPKEGLGSPIAAALSSFATFSVGALVPLAGASGLSVARTYAYVASGADGIMVEVHPRPEEAWSDGEQSLTLPKFARLAGELRTIHAVSM